MASSSDGKLLATAREDGTVRLRKPEAHSEPFAALPHPCDYTDKVIFRRSPACGERNIVRDNDFTCALCSSALPAHWNFISN